MISEFLNLINLQLARSKNTQEDTRIISGSGVSKRTIVLICLHSHKKASIIKDNWQITIYNVTELILVLTYSTEQIWADLVVSSIILIPWKSVVPSEILIYWSQMRICSWTNRGVILNNQKRGGICIDLGWGTLKLGWFTKQWVWVWVNGLLEKPSNTNWTDHALQTLPPTTYFDGRPYVHLERVLVAASNFGCYNLSLVPVARLQITTFGAPVFK